MRYLPTTLPYKLCIYPGVDIQRALRCIALYLETENATRIGQNSMCLFGYEAPGNNELYICVYRTETMIVVRNN